MLNKLILFQAVGSEYTAKFLDTSTVLQILNENFLLFTITYGLQPFFKLSDANFTDVHSYKDHSKCVTPISIIETNQLIATLKTFSVDILKGSI